MGKIYTRDEAMAIVELFENVLDRYNITVPSDEDDDRDPETSARLFGSTYYELVDAVEYNLVQMFLEYGFSCRNILTHAINAVEDLVVEGRQSGSEAL